MPRVRLPAEEVPRDRAHRGAARRAPRLRVRGVPQGVPDPGLTPPAQTGPQTEHTAPTAPFGTGVKRNPA